MGRKKHRRRDGYWTYYHLAHTQEKDSVVENIVSLVRELGRTGKSLGMFMEKPLAESSEDAKRIMERSNSIGRTNMIGFQKRFLPEFQRVKSLIDRGGLGDLLFFKSYSFVSSVFSSGKG